MRALEGSHSVCEPDWLISRRLCELKKAGSLLNPSTGLAILVINVGRIILDQLFLLLTLVQR